MFGNTCKTAFEAIIFVFVVHPFDVGDRCLIDGVQVNFPPTFLCNCYNSVNICIYDLADDCRRDEYTDNCLLEIQQ